MTTVFGKGLRGRRKPEVEDDVAQIADEANLWWTRRDFVQNPVVRTRVAAPASSPGTTPPPRPAAEAAPVVDPALAGRGFNEVFTTESLFGPAPAPADRPATAAADRMRAHRPRPEPAAAPMAETAPTAPSGAAARPRPRVPVNHPLFPALVRLGLAPEATWHDVQQAYRRLAKEAHPDRSGDGGEAMADLNAAYHALREARRYGIFGDD